MTFYVPDVQANLFRTIVSNLFWREIRPEEVEDIVFGVFNLDRESNRKAPRDGLPHPDDRSIEDEDEEAAPMAGGFGLSNVDPLGEGQCPAVRDDSPEARAAGVRCTKPVEHVNLGDPTHVGRQPRGDRKGDIVDLWS